MRRRSVKVALLAFVRAYLKVELAVKVSFVDERAIQATLQRVAEVIDGTIDEVDAADRVDSGRPEQAVVLIDVGRRSPGNGRYTPRVVWIGMCRGLAVRSGHDIDVH